MRATTFAAAAALLTSQLTHAIDLDLSSDDSIKAAAKSVAQGLVQGYYTNQSNIPGLLGDTYFFWSAGAMWDTLVNYWYLTGDSTYNDVASQALLFQVGDNNDYMPANQTKDLGNDDQATWALAALTAAERKFPNPPSGKPQWIDLAKNVFDEQVNRWDNSTCDGGLRWQIFPFNNGYDYKQAQSFFFLLAARLAQNTGNATYSQWAEMAYNWTSTTLMSDQFAVYDGAQVAQNCSQASKLEWSYNQAAFLYGSAVMFNMTSSTMWQQRVMGHLQHFSSTFFYGNGTSSSGSGTILYEPACEVNNKCSTDQTFFKGLTSRWMAQTIVSAPFTSAKITPLLQASAKGAAAACTSGSDGADCGFHWYTGSNDGLKGAGEQLSALEAIQQNLKQEAPSSSSTNTSSPSPTGSNSPSHTAQGGMGATVHVTWSVLFAGVLAALF